MNSCTEILQAGMFAKKLSHYLYNEDSQINWNLLSRSHNKKLKKLILGKLSEVYK